MKKLLLLSLFAFVALAVNAQTYTYAMGAKTYASSGVDRVITNTTVVNLVWFAPNDNPTTQDFLVQLDSTSGNHTNVAVQLMGAKFATGAYSNIGSAVNWTGSTGDTTIVISNATANRYRYYKIVVTGTGTGTTTIDSHELKLYQE